MGSAGECQVNGRRLVNKIIPDNRSVESKQLKENN
jgi:hypothetical protein